MLDIKVLRNNRARKFEQSSRIKRNCLPFTRKNGYTHYLIQFNLCWEAFKNKQEFLVEAVLDTPNLKERLRADFVNLDTGQVIEVAVTEDAESLQKKDLIWQKYGFEMVVEE